MRHYLKIRDFSADEMREVLKMFRSMKEGRGKPEEKILNGETWALIFAKSSTRTRVSFQVGLLELGATPLFLSANDIQLGRGELICDTARTLGRMLHGAVIRTYAQGDVEDFAKYSGITTINALTDEEHPCQIMTDIATIEELRGPIQDQKVVFVGDGACNVPLSWVSAAKLLGFELVIAAPEKYQPSAKLLENTGVKVTDCIEDAVRGADVLYTDVWVSMGKEEERHERVQSLGRYQINRETLSLAKPDAMVMHCLPAYRGMEISEEVFEANADTIFTQAENRLHTQKAIIKFLRNR